MGDFSNRNREDMAEPCEIASGTPADQGEMWPDVMEITITSPDPTGPEFAFHPLQVQKSPPRLGRARRGSGRDKLARHFTTEKVPVWICWPLRMRSV